MENGQTEEEKELTVYELVGNLLQFIIQNRGEDDPTDVISAFQMAAAQVGCAFEKEVGEVVAMQQMLFYRIKGVMIKDGTFGCGTRGMLVDLTQN